jgi:transposase
MQTQLPLFPSGTGLINSNLGVQVDSEKTLWYLLNGSPIHFHTPDDQNQFRYVTSHLIFVGLCSQAEIERFFHVSPSSIQRYLKIYREQGAAGFISGSGRKGGVRYKTTPELVEKIQKLLDRGDSQSSIARKFKISEGTIRYQIQQGVLKKKA